MSRNVMVDGLDGFQYYWSDPQMPEEMYATRASGDGSVMVWGAIGYNGKKNLQFIDHRLNA